MPLFTRRRLQAMLKEIAMLIEPEQARGLLGRIENKRIETGGVDEDDDHLVLSLDDDPGARSLTLPNSRA